MSIEVLDLDSNKRAQCASIKVNDKSSGTIFMMTFVDQISINFAVNLLSNKKKISNLIRSTNR